MLFMLITFSRKKKKSSPDNLIYYTTLVLCLISNDVGNQDLEMKIISSYYYKMLL